MRLSYTKLDLYEFCPHAYRLRYLERLPIPFSPALLVGSSVHTALRGLFERLRDGLSATWDDLLDVYARYWDEAPNIDPVRDRPTWERGLGLLRGYWDANVENLGRPILLEARFFFRLPNATRHTVEGYVDRVDALGSGVEIIDYKSGRSPETLGASLHTQLQTYALAAEHAFGHRVERLTAYFLSDNRKHSIQSAHIDAEFVTARYQYAGDAIANNQFEATPGSHCATCDYANRCEFRAG